jgi:hypothetical protein
MKIPAEISEKMMDTAKMVLLLKSSFARNHLQAAVGAARDAYKVEQANANAEFGAWFEEMMRLVPVSVVMAGAALEASANELIQDILDGSTNLSVTKGCKLLLMDLKDERSGNATDKHRKLALLFDKEPETGKVAWQDGELLVKFRNSFMHFKPAWDDEAIHSGALVKGLKTRMHVARAYQSSFQFPYGFMTYGCAKWAVQTVLTFSSTFTKLLGVTDKFSLPGLDFKLL